MSLPQEKLYEIQVCQPGLKRNACPEDTLPWHSSLYPRLFECRRPLFARCCISRCLLRLPYSSQGQYL